MKDMDISPTTCLALPASCRTLVHPLGNVPLVTTISASFQLLSNLWRHATFFYFTRCPTTFEAINLAPRASSTRFSSFNDVPLHFICHNQAPFRSPCLRQWRSVFVGHRLQHQHLGTFFLRPSLAQASHWSIRVFAAYSSFCHIMSRL